MISSITSRLFLMLIVVSLVVVAVVASEKPIPKLSSRDIPLFGGSSSNKSIQNRIETAKELAALEQSIEDVNAQWIASSATKGQAVSYRRLIAMPLTEYFNPSMGHFSHGHIQTGDKMSLPRNFQDAITLNKAEVPWLFEVSRIEGVTGDRVVVSPEDEEGDEDQGEEETKKKSKKDKNKNRKGDLPSDQGAARPLDQNLDSVVGSCLDFRAPSNYIFLPWWMMRALGLKPRDVVDVRQITTVPAGSMVKFRPLKEQTMIDMANPQAVLETELRHYSSMTKGATIPFDYNKKRYWFEVVECRSAPRGEKKPIIKTQDCDVATDFLQSKEKLKELQKKRKAKLAAAAAAAALESKSKK